MNFSRDDVNYAIEELDYFSSYGKHGSLAGVIFLVLREAYKKSDELMKKGCCLNIFSASPAILESFVAVHELFDLNDKMRVKIYEGLIQIYGGHFSFFGPKLKIIFLRITPAILESFVAVHELFDLNDKMRVKIYEGLIQIYGGHFFFFGPKLKIIFLRVTVQEFICFHFQDEQAI
ncbi:unnamed protein product [Gongylonema pulchrum]|uniref:Uncharacterized protein n=1 Tax=Gongylonema pulchrum TaxID=637853 RepID=A0A3P7LZY7_9BILA|nr:unnamed protein product [Gongylonema pulchrum]